MPRVGLPCAGGRRATQADGVPPGSTTGVRPFALANDAPRSRKVEPHQVITHLPRRNTSGFAKWMIGSSANPHAEALPQLSVVLFTASQRPTSPASRTCTRAPPGVRSSGRNGPHRPKRSLCPQCPAELDAAAQARPSHRHRMLCEFIAIVGESGSGNSTLVRLALGLEEPSSGAVYYDGRDLARLDHASVRRQIGTAIQDGEGLLSPQPRARHLDQWVPRPRAIASRAHYLRRTRRHVSRRQACAYKPRRVRRVTHAATRSGPDGTGRIDPGGRCCEILRSGNPRHRQTRRVRRGDRLEGPPSGASPERPELPPIAEDEHVHPHRGADQRHLQDDHHDHAEPDPEVAGIRPKIEECRNL